jgi:hypothetical protein
MALLTADEILGADDLPTRDVDVPEWGGTVRIRALSGKERDAFEASIAQQKGRSTRANLENLRARLVAKCAIGPDGKRLFSDSAAVALGQKSAAALDRVFEAARKLNRMTDDDVAELTEDFPEEDGEPSSSD